METIDTANNPNEADVRLGHINYLLLAIGFVTVVTTIVAVVIAYVKRPDARGTYLANHFTWQIRTFWWSLLWTVVGWITLPVLIGYPILLAAVIWVIYRIVKGWLRLNDARPAYDAA